VEPKGGGESITAGPSTLSKTSTVGSTSDRTIGCSRCPALSFDLSVYDLLGLLAAGGTIVLPPSESAREPRGWLELLRRQGVTVWNTVPALLEMLVEHVDGCGGRLPDSLRLVCSARLDSHPPARPVAPVRVPRVDHQPRGSNRGIDLVDLSPRRRRERVLAQHPVRAPTCQPDHLGARRRASGLPDRRRSARSTSAVSAWPEDISATRPARVPASSPTSAGRGVLYGRAIWVATCRTARSSCSGAVTARSR